MSTQAYKKKAGKLLRLSFQSFEKNISTNISQQTQANLFLKNDVFIRRGTILSQKTSNNQYHPYMGQQRQQELKACRERMKALLQNWRQHSHKWRGER